MQKQAVSVSCEILFQSKCLFRCVNYGFVFCNSYLCVKMKFIYAFMLSF